MTGFGSVPRHYLNVLEGMLGSEKVASVQDRKDCLLEKVSVGIIGDGLTMARASGDLSKTAVGGAVSEIVGFLVSRNSNMGKAV